MNRNITKRQNLYIHLVIGPAAKILGSRSTRERPGRVSTHSRSGQPPDNGESSRYFRKISEICNSNQILWRKKIFLTCLIFRQIWRKTLKIFQGIGLYEEPDDDQC